MFVPGKEILSPLGSATFMKRFDAILAGRVPVSDITSPEGKKLGSLRTSTW